MMEEKPGYGFRPYEDELVDFLLHKIEGKHSHVDGVIKQIDNICSFDPWDLRFQSKIKSRDPLWYFVSPRENNGSKQNRRTPSGFWKLTGVAVNVKDQWGHVSGVKGKKIGQKRVLTFHSENPESISSENNRSAAWVMHEFHYTLLPEDKRTYVICRLEYKGDDMNILSGDPTPTFASTMDNSASSVVDQGNYYYNTFSEFDSGHQFSEIFDTHQSFPGYSDHNSYPILDMEYALTNQSDWFLEQPPQVPYSAPLQYDLDTRQRLESLEMMLMREDPSRYRPKKSITGVVRDYSLSDSDTDSTIGRDAWSSTDSVGSKDGPCHTPKEDDTPPLSTIEPLHTHEAQEQPKQLELQGTEKVINKQKSESERKMAEHSIKKAPSTTAAKQSWIVLEEMSQRNSRWVHFNNMLIGLLLFISSIVWIIVVG